MVIFYCECVSDRIRATITTVHLAIAAAVLLLAAVALLLLCFRRYRNGHGPRIHTAKSRHGALSVLSLQSVINFVNRRIPFD